MLRCILNRKENNRSLSRQPAQIVAFFGFIYYSIFTVRRSISFLLPALIIFLTPEIIFADSEVSIQNNVNASSNTTSTNTTHTSIHIESNGQVQDYNSDNGGDVHMQSGDGHARVDITNHINSANTVSPTQMPTHSPTITNSPTPTIGDTNKKNQEVKGLKEQKINMHSEMQNIFQRIFSFLKSLFKF